MINVKNLIWFICLVSGAANPAFSQFPSDSINLNESKVIPYSLPDVFAYAKTEQELKNAGEWMNVQRPFIYHLFEENVYGRFHRRFPFITAYGNRIGMPWEALAIRKQVRLFLNPGDTTVYVDVLLYLPKNKKGPVPVFLGLNFNGNATTIRGPVGISFRAAGISQIPGPEYGFFPRNKIFAMAGKRNPFQRNGYRDRLL